MRSIGFGLERVAWPALRWPTTQGGGHYAGSFNSLASKGPATLSGQDSASRPGLDADFVDTFSGAPSKSVNSIDVLPQGYRLSTSRINPKDGKTYTSSEIIFTAK